jgi:cyanophycinase
MVEKAGKGPVVIIGSSPPPEPPEAPAEGKAPVAPEVDTRIAMFKALGVERVESLDLHADNADLQATYDTIAAARIVYIRGGAQSRYVEFWKGTKTEAAIRRVFEAGGAVGGTSAGCAILGSVSYDALKGSLSTAEVLADGRHEELTLTKGFLGCTPGVLFDTHFTQRGRIGRLAVMLATVRVDDPALGDVVGLGVDEKTALCVDRAGFGTVIGEGTVSLVELSATSVVELEKGKPPLVTDVVVSRAPAGCRIDVAKRAVMWAWPTEVACGSAAPALAAVRFAGTEAERAEGSVVLRGKAWTGERAGKTLATAFRELATCTRRVSFLLDPGAAVSVAGARGTIEAEGARAQSAVVLWGGGRTLSGVPEAAAVHGVVDGVRMHIVPPGAVVGLGDGEVRVGAK